jgi:hypothetical protein
MISRAATASVMASAFCGNNIAAFSRLPAGCQNAPSMPLTSAGTNAIPRGN